MKDNTVPEVEYNEDGYIVQKNKVQYRFHDDDPRYVDVGVTETTTIASIDLEKGTIVLDGSRELTAEQLSTLANMIRELQNKHNEPPF
tara:strand:- start:3942 stop:4205 length:264 start_codon:yes stop_codon:yes gene_type:complete